MQNLFELILMCCRRRHRRLNKWQTMWVSYARRIECARCGRCKGGLRGLPYQSRRNPEMFSSVVSYLFRYFLFVFVTLRMCFVFRFMVSDIYPQSEIYFAFRSVHNCGAQYRTETWMKVTCIHLFVLIVVPFTLIEVPHRRHECAEFRAHIMSPNSVNATANAKRCERAEPKVSKTSSLRLFISCFYKLFRRSCVAGGKIFKGQIHRGEQEMCKWQAGVK